MSGLIEKIKGLFTPDRADQAGDAIEQNVTDERVDNMLNRVPGGDRVADHVPENVGERAADAVRDAGGAVEDEAPKPPQ